MTKFWVGTYIDTESEYSCVGGHYENIEIIYAMSEQEAIEKYEEIHNSTFFHPAIKYRRKI